MEEPVYFATLEQYRLSPAMVIGVTEGTDVAAMWEAQITDITHSNELGNLVTMSFGDGYECIYPSPRASIRFIGIRMEPSGWEPITMV